MTRGRFAIRGVWILAVCVVVVALSGTARADQSVIRHPGHHPDYSWEIEPHVLVAPFDHPGRAGGGGGFGARATVILVDNGFVKTINNSVGIGFGGDLLFAPSAGLWVPVVMQWNFWLTRNWSVFGEPGVGMYLGRNNFGAPIFAAGGRLKLSESLQLTARIGYPHITAGVSFLF